MRWLTCFCLLLAITPAYVQAAPAPKPQPAAVINAGSEKNIVAVLEEVVWFARVGVREDEKVAGLDIIRRQKDWESWLKKNLRVERVKDTNLVRVSFRDGNQEEQAAIINVVVDYYLKNDVGSTRKSLTETLTRNRQTLDELVRKGRITGDRKAKAEEKLKKDEEYIRALPVLVEHAKPR
jgi:hypothetical protein